MKLRPAVVCAVTAGVVVALLVGPESPVGAAGKARPGPHPSDRWPGGQASAHSVRTALQAHRPAARAQVRHLDSRLQTAPTRSDGTVEVNVRGDNRSLDAALRKARARPVASVGTVRTALVPRGALGTLASTSGVTAVDQPVRALPTDTFQGVAASGADVWHSAGQNGAGVNIGIVDAGFTNLSSEVTAGNLPAGQTVTGNHCANVNDTQHGTAVSEVVHSMAPSAKLFLYCIDDSIGFMQAEQEIHQYNVDHPASPIKIVTSSLGFPGDSRGDGAGADTSAATTVKTARRAGILWIESTGNNGEDHWSGTFTDSSPRDGLGDLNPTVNPAQADSESDDVAVLPGGTTTLVLQWDHWPTTTAGDAVTFLYLHYDCDTGKTIGSVQSTAAVAGQAPVLGFQITNPSPSAAACYAVAVRLGSAVPHYHYDLSYWGDVEQSVYAFLAPAAAAKGSITEPASSPYALGVGAAYWQNKTLEPFSSQGPTIDGRAKPDITAFDGVNVGAGLTEFSDGFYGTSAAAPHVAGAAALVAAANPSLDAAQIQDFLERRAGTSPPTQQLGHGALELADPALSGIVSPHGSGYTPLPTPVRVLDTRHGTGGRSTPLGTGQTVTVSLPADAGVPSDATAIAVNLTGTNATGSTFLTIYPGDRAYPGTSNLNLAPKTDAVAAIFTVVTLGAGRTFTVRNAAVPADALVDVLGYFSPSSTGKYSPISPVRILDTRYGTGTGGVVRTLGAGQTITVTPPASVGVPADAVALVVNVTAAHSLGAGFFTASPDGSGATSTLNYLHYDRANLTIVGLDQTGSFRLHGAGAAADAIVDVEGYVSPNGSSTYVPLPSPVRIVDSRTGNGGRNAILGTQTAMTVHGGGIFDVPYAAKALLTGTVAISATGGGYFSVYPDGTARPSASSVNFTARRVVPNGVLAGLSSSPSGGAFDLYNALGTTNAVVDLFGYFV